MEQYLQHYGIKGQKWGIRRFQYENGSYTPEGKERYSKGSSDSDDSGPRKGPTRFGGTGKTGYMTDTQVYYLTSAASFLVRKAAYKHREKNAKKEIEEAGINKDKERISKDNLQHMCMNYNRKERHAIIDRMKKNPNMTYDRARTKADDMHFKRVMRNTGIYLASCVALPLAVIYGPKVINNTLDSLGRNKKFQDFMEYFYAKKLKRDKNIITLRKDQYEIDKKWNLPEGRG